MIIGKPKAQTIRGTRRADRIEAVDGRRDVVRCRGGRDTALIDERDRTIGCEVVARRVAVDRTKGSGQHATVLEPQMAAQASTIVAVFQSGRHSLAGADAIGFATSHDGGTTWRSGLLPGLTSASPSPASWKAASNASVAYDAAHGRWLAESAVIRDDAGAVEVSSSTDGRTWQSPVVAFSVPRKGPTDAAFDKPWIACDRSEPSPHYGRCYLAAALDVELPSARMAIWTSDDGGKTWTASPAHLPAGNGAQPVVQPNGTLVVLYTDLRADDAFLEAVHSTDGGTTFGNPAHVSPDEIGETVPDGLRAPLFPSAAVTADGTIVVAWPACAGSACGHTDIVLSRSHDGVSWSAPARLPLGQGDNLSPGLAVNAATGRLAVAYVVSQSPVCCELEVRLAVQQSNGSWHVAQPSIRSMQERWTASSPGAFLGDYLSAAFSNGRAVALLPVALPRAHGRRQQALFAVRQR